MAKITKKENETDIATKTIAKIKYDFIADRIGAETTSELLGDFKDSDPNEVLIEYDKIALAYTVPITEYSNTKLDSQVDSEQLEKMLTLLEKAESISRSQKAPNVVQFARNKK